MKKVFFLSVSVAVVSLVYFSSCKAKKEAAKTACTSSPTFTADMKPIFESNCMPCHNSEKHKHNIDLSNYEGAKDAAKGKNFLGAIRHEQGFDAMPPPPQPPLADTKKLSDETIEKISCWIQNGMPK